MATAGDVEYADSFAIPGQYTYADGYIYGDLAPRERIDEVRDLELKEDDVLIVSYPKTGTTVTQEIVWLILHKVDVDTALKVPTFDRVPFLEYEPPLPLDRGTGRLQLFSSQSSPRCAKSHLPWAFLPRDVHKGKGKCVYVVRNPKDTLVSYYHFYRSNSTLGCFEGTWNSFFELFRKDALAFGDIFDHFLQTHNQKDKPNVHIVKYEDLLKDKRVEILKIAEFLGKKLDNEQVTKIIEKTTFNFMKSEPNMNLESDPVINEKISPFMRKGEIGDWMNYFNDEQREFVDRMTRERLEPVGLYLEDGS